MAETLTLKLDLIFNKPIADLYGSWEYAAATASVSPSEPYGESAVLTAYKRTNAFESFMPTASMLSGTILFPNGELPENMTFQGMHDLTTNDEAGSISAASARFAAYIGGQFTFNAADGILTIQPRPEGQ